MMKLNKGVNLTARQEAFVHYLVNSGHNATEAARRAGYEGTAIRQNASQLMRKPHIQEAIRREQFLRLNGNLANLALSTLEGVMTDPAAPHGAKVQAAIAVLERSGIHHNVEAKRIENESAPLNQMSREQLEAFVIAGANRIAELKGLRSTVVTDGTA